MYNKLFFILWTLIFLKFLCCRSEYLDAFSVKLSEGNVDANSEKTESDSEIETTNVATSEESVASTETQEASTIMTEAFTTHTTESQRNKTLEGRYIIKDICTKFKYAGRINLNKMVDLWQTTYYRAPQKVPCFKMFIRKLTMKEKHLYKQKYGNFDEAVEWEDCNLEIKSSMEIKKHFLQGCEKGHGVLENIIISDKNDNASNISLKPESPDQWLVVQNLLLKRNCDTGDVIAFSRVPHKPHNKIINEALKLFGEKSADGKFICGDQPPIKKKPYQIDEEVNESI